MARMTGLDAQPMFPAAREGDGLRGVLRQCARPGRGARGVAVEPVAKSLGMVVSRAEARGADLVVELHPEGVGCRAAIEVLATHPDGVRAARLGLGLEFELGIVRGSRERL